MPTMKVCASQALKTYKDEKRIIDEKKDKGIVVGISEHSRPWVKFYSAIEKAIFECDKDSDYYAVGAAYIEYQQARVEYHKNMGHDLGAAYILFTKKKNLIKAVEGLNLGNRAIRI